MQCRGRTAPNWRRSKVITTSVSSRSASATTEASVPPSGKSPYRSTSSAMRAQSSTEGASTSSAPWPPTAGRAPSSLAAQRASRRPSARVAALRARDQGLAALVRCLVELEVARVAIERPNGLLVDRLLEAGIVVVAVHPGQLAARDRYRRAAAAEPPSGSSRW